MGVGGHCIAGHIDVAAHHLCGSSEDGGLFRGDSFDFDEIMVVSIDPERAFDEVGRFVVRRDGNREAGAAINDTRDARLELHVVVRSAEPRLRDAGWIADGLFIF